MNPVSPLFEKIDASIRKEGESFEKQLFTLRCSSGSRLLIFDFRNGCGICNRDEGEDIAHGLERFYTHLCSAGSGQRFYT